MPIRHIPDHRRPRKKQADKTTVGFHRTIHSPRSVVNCSECGTTIAVKFLSDSRHTPINGYPPRHVTFPDGKTRLVCTPCCRRLVPEERREYHVRDRGSDDESFETPEWAEKMGLTG